MDISDVLTVKTLSQEEMRHWTGETAQGLRALAAFVEDPVSTPSPQIMTHSYLSLGQFQGNQPPSRLRGQQVFTWCTYIHACTQTKHSQA